MEEASKEKSKKRGMAEQRIAIVTIIVVVVLVIFAIILTVNEEVNGSHLNNNLEIIDSPVAALES